MTHIDVLKQARELLSARRRWCRGAGARNERRDPVQPWNPAAVSFCSIGALTKVVEGRYESGGHVVHDLNEIRLTAKQSQDLYANATICLLDALPPAEIGTVSLAGFNDDVSTTHADIVALFDRAIALAEERAKHG